MKTSIYSRHRFHPDIIRRAAWMYFRFTPIFFDIAELMGTTSYQETHSGNSDMMLKLSEF